MKRFIDTEVWDDEWFAELQPKLKLLWVYLFTNCDSAGVWKQNRKLAEYQLKTVIEWEKSLTAFGERVVLLSNSRLWVPSFVHFQYGTLSPEAKVHQSVIKSLTAQGLYDAYQEYRKVKTMTPQSHTYPISMGYIDGEGKGQGEGDGKKGGCKGENKARPESPEEVVAFCEAEKIPLQDAAYFWDKWNGNGFQNAGKAMKCWRSVIRSWRTAGHLPSQKASNGSGYSRKPDLTRTVQLTEAELPEVWDPMKQ